MVYHTAKNVYKKSIPLQLIFLVIGPFFNGFFAYILISFDDYQSLYFSFEDFTFFIFLAYITTFIPALVTGIIYGVSSPTRNKTTLLWLLPILGCVIYLIYTMIFEMVTHLFGGAIIYIALITALLSIGGNFIATLTANVILKGKSL